MGKRKKVAYVVLKGHRTGIFDTWEETQRATKGFKKIFHERLFVGTSDYRREHLPARSKKPLDVDHVGR